jgi:signal transduction histidine kinase
MRTLRHELRTPINHIVGYSELMLDEARETRADVVAEQAGQIRTQGRALADLLELALSAEHNVHAGGLGQVRPRLRSAIETALMTCEPKPGILNNRSYLEDLGRIKQALIRLSRLVDTL